MSRRKLKSLVFGGLLLQWVSNCGPLPTASVSPGHLLEMQVLGVTWDLVNQKPWGCFPEIRFNKPSGWFRCTLKFENHCFNILFSFQRLISFPKPQQMGCSTDAKKEPVYFNFIHWRKTIPTERHTYEPTSWLWWSANIQCFSLASCLPLWDHMCWILRACSQRSGWVSAFLSWLKGCSSRRQRKPGCLSSMLFLSRIQVPSHSTWLFSVEEPLAFRTWHPCVGRTISLHYPAHLLSWISDLVLSADFGWVFDFLFGETEEMSKYVKTFEWATP